MGLLEWFTDRFAVESPPNNQRRRLKAAAETIRKAGERAAAEPAIDAFEIAANGHVRPHPGRKRERRDDVG